MDIGAFEDPAIFRSRMDGIIRQIHASRPAPGVDRIYVPGERAAETERRYRAEGIPLTDATRRALSEVAARVGVDAVALQ